MGGIIGALIVLNDSNANADPTPYPALIFCIVLGVIALVLLYIIRK